MKKTIDWDGISKRASAMSNKELQNGVNSCLQAAEQWRDRDDPTAVEGYMLDQASIFLIQMKCISHYCRVA